MRLLVLSLILPALLLAGCADDGADEADEDAEAEQPATSPANNTTLEPVTLDVSLSGAYPINIAFEPSALAAQAGQNVTVRFTNDDQAPVFSHDWVLEGVEGAATASVGNGETAEVTFTAPPAGTYAFYCSVPGHRDNGMEGTFTVA